MNINNKYGQCCNCPPFMNDNRMFTIWESNKLYHYNLSQHYDISNNNTLRSKMINNPEILNKYNDNILNSSLCENTNE